jgi:putative ABC transport system ATP-binding protein|tara:strand:- start:1579 stop:2271 length:693 start_codon:yes stop_codon:yes gene_type:complete
MPNLISTDKLTKEYTENLLKPVRVLNNLCLSIREGDFVSLMGPSGSGKSTLLNLLGLLDVPTNGEIFFDGLEITRLTRKKKAILRNISFGFIFQGFNLLKRHSVLDNVMMPLLYRKVSRKEASESARNVLEATGLIDFVERLPNQLSGGQQQRVAICRALVMKPKLILADEPTGNLDSVTARQIMKILCDLNCDQGITVVLVTHEREIAQHGNRLIKMRDGIIHDDETLR